MSPFVFASALAAATIDPLGTYHGGDLLGAVEMAYPFPSPDNRSVAFQANFEGRWQLYLMNIEDGSFKRLTNSTDDDKQPSFSPDGMTIAFVSNRGGTDSLFLYDIATGTSRALIPTGDWDGHPHWSADGEWIIFNRTPESDHPIERDNGAIFKVRPDGTDLTMLASTPLTETYPSFDPTGARFVYVEWHENEAGERNRNGELIVVDSAAGERRNITESFAFDGYPYWGASGDWIYFSSAIEGPEGREMVVFRVRPDGSERQQLTTLDGLWEVRAVPSADERWLYYNLELGDRNAIYRRPLTP